MSVWQSFYLSSLGIRVGDLASLPPEVVVEFERLANGRAVRNRPLEREFWHLTAPIRRARARAARHAF